MRTDELYAHVTNTIIKELEAGVIPWTQPWKLTGMNGVAYVPTNVSTGRMYNGINTLILWAAAMEKGYTSHGWMTFKQAVAFKANVRKGEKASPILFIKRKEEIDKDTGKPTIAIIPKAWSVFHVEQLENLPETYQQKAEELPSDTVYQEALRLIRDCGVKLNPNSDRACYVPSLDLVEMPPPSAFVSEEDYFGVTFHELVHSTGHKKRLNRELSTRFGKESYAMEELVAELGSAFICARVGIPARHRSASYVESWLKAFKKDPKAIFTAASMAAKAADFLHEQTYAVQDNTPEVEQQTVSL